MKKKIVVFFVFCIMILNLVGCEKTFKNYDFKEVNLFDENIVDIYRKEASLRNPKNFFSEEEIKIFEEEGYTVFEKMAFMYKLDTYSGEKRVCYFPMIFSYNKELYFLYTNDSGILRIEPINGKTDIIPYTRYVHTDQAGIIHSNAFRTVIYNQDTCSVIQYEWGKEIKGDKLPLNTEYCGESSNLGFIFKLRDDVYALTLDPMYPKEYQHYEYIQIASNVQKVIETDYNFDNNNAKSQPLFLMKDNTVRAYVEWEIFGKEPDDQNHLRPLEDKTNG